MAKQTPDSERKNEHQVSGWSVMISALAALIGVQSRKNQERDFQSGQFWHFVVAGIVVTVLFMLMVWGMVQLLLSTANAG